ncbi:MAG: NADH-quinone oxidoreductase subunit L [Actinobacteria bacterium]|nr:NADH-quinone oxidoreductase subunit L [Actinomycetota bacterium]
MAQIIWYIPLLPVAGFIIALLIGRRFGNIGSRISTAIMGLCILLSFYTVFLVFTRGPISIGMTWYITGNIKISMGMLADGLSAMMLVVVSIVSFLVHLYSMGYMHGDSRFWLFYAYLQLFSASMLGLVFANNYLQLYIFWELVGLCSYLLIGFWYEKQAASDAAKKAFLVTRIGDVGMLIGLLLLFFNTGTLVFGDVFGAVSSGRISSGIVTAATILIFCGAMGKSAQFPFHVWLPDAMEGPTPVSALIHAATMVAAGVYLVGRSFPLFSQSPQTMLVVAIIGTFTAIFAATIAVVQTDIKKILAYSTISQLGYMMFALGIGAFAAGMFHLMTNAFFKALLFLGSGSVIHSTHTQEITEMGGLSKKMKTTTWTFIVGALSLSGFPLLAGFWSKDEILGFAFENGRYIIFIVGAFTAFLTAFYMFRLIFTAFYGKPSRASEHAHESPKSMTIPLVILAVFAALAGYVGIPFLLPEKYSIAKFISGSMHLPEAEFNVIPMIISVSVGLIGILLAYLMYGKKVMPKDWFYRYVKPYYKVLVNKYYMDDFNSMVIVGSTIKFANLINRFDKGIIDGFINLVGKVTVIISKGVHIFDSGVIDSLVNWTANETYNSGKRLRLLQTGNISGYAIVMFGVLAVYVVYLIIRIQF